jgi:hypothetical protein
MDRNLIEQYAAGGPLLLGSIDDLTDADWAAHPVPGTWSLREIVVHLLDSDLVAADRMKRIIAMDNPTLLAFPENDFVQRLGYNDLDAMLAADIFAQNRQFMASILRGLPDAAFARQGTHNERGPTTLAALVGQFVTHLNHHLEFFRQKRAMLGKPL